MPRKKTLPPLEVPSYQVADRDITTIYPYDKNPKQNEAAIDPVARSIKRFGFRQPIVVDEQGVIIVGHTRYKAALKLGLRVVPVHVAVGMTPAEARAYRIADNQTSNLADWDESLLKSELDALTEMEFDLELLAFPQDELDELTNEPAFTEGRGQTPAEAALDYVERGIKRVTLFFSTKDYDSFVSRLDSAGKSLGVDNHTDTVIKLLEHYEHGNT